MSPNDGDDRVAVRLDVDVTCGDLHVPTVGTDLDRGVPPTDRAPHPVPRPAPEWCGRGGRRRDDGRRRLRCGLAGSGEPVATPEPIRAAPPVVDQVELAH